MKIIKRTTYSIIAILITFIGCISCESTELEILDNPNEVSATESDIDFFLNSIQVAALTVFEGTPNNDLGLSEAGMDMSRIDHAYGPTYQNAYAPTALNQVWRAVYSGALPDIRTMTPVAEEQELYTHVAIAKTLEVYMMVAMVDFFGDVPYSEATQGTEFPNPNVDSGETIYDAMFHLLEEAEADFNRSEVNLPSNDLFYGGDESKWIKFINTLRLKMLIQTRLVDSSVASKINAIIAEGNYIASAEDDFQMQWSSTDNNPDSRHPDFGVNFDNGTSDYMSTSFMYWLVAEKGMKDPRTRYYFYRQTGVNTTDPNEQSCVTQFPPAHFGPQDIFCNFSNEGYWGRVHFDANGIPPDRGLRTTFGVYPVGGLFDDDSFSTITSRNIGLQGAGISPILLSSYVDFMLAESALTLNTSGSARAYLERGIRKSMDKVLNFAPDLIDPNFAATSSDVDDYLAIVLDQFDNAASNEDKLEIIVKEYMIALFGNGIEAYNAYRRTGKPYLQQALIADPGPFMRSFFYPQVFVDQNSVVDQKADQSIPVFWDNGSANLN